MDEAVAAIAAHLGIVNEEEIDNMSIPFFNSVLAALGKKLNYESISNLYGNSFAKDAGKYINEANPLVKHNKMADFANFLNTTKITKIKKGSTQEVKTDALSKSLGDISWAEGLV